jgi:hypothetical protein
VPAVLNSIFPLCIMLKILQKVPFQCHRV